VFGFEWLWELENVADLVFVKELWSVKGVGRFERNVDVEADEMKVELRFVCALISD